MQQLRNTQLPKKKKKQSMSIKMYSHIRLLSVFGYWSIHIEKCILMLALVQVELSLLLCFVRYLQNAYV